MTRCVTVGTLAVLVAVLAFPAGAAAADQGTIYRKYAKVRDQMTACSIDRGWRHLSSSKRRTCKRLRRRYVLYAFYDSPGKTFIKCKTRRCPRRPIGVPNPRGPIPSDARVFR